MTIVGAVGEHRGDRAVDLVEQRADQGCVALVRGGQLRGEDLTAVGIDRQMELRQLRRGLLPCFSNCHSPAPNTFSPALSITKSPIRPPVFSAAATPRSTLRREKVVWSGTGRSKPSSPMTDFSMPSV